MKNIKKLILPLFLFIFIIPNIFIFAQPTITQAEFSLGVGDIFTVYPETTYVAPTEGANQIWDYTSLSTSGGTVFNTIDPGSSGIIGLPASTLCYENGGNSACYLIDAIGMQLTGGGPSPASMPYQDGELIFNFPIAFGTNMTDSFYSIYSFLGNPASRRGVDTISVVGYGTLNLPASVTITNVMQVKTHRVFIDSIYSGSWNVISYDYTSYSFFAASYHGYILTMGYGTSTPGGPTEGGTYSLSAPGNGLETFDISENLEVYPNPAEDEFTLTNSGNIDISGFKYSIVNMQGQMMRSGIINGDNLNFDVSTMTTGLYILNINGEHFNASKRFIKK